MGRIECSCGRILWEDTHTHCPSCGRSLHLFRHTLKEYGSERARPKPPPTSTPSKGMCMSCFTTDYGDGCECQKHRRWIMTEAPWWRRWGFRMAEALLLG